MNRTPKRNLYTRRVHFDYPSVGGRLEHYVAGDLVSSHSVAVLSGLFPEGEDFFIRSVRHYRDQITDPELTKQVAAFIGQEVTHGREHRALNEQLDRMGYRAGRTDRSAKFLLSLGERFLSARQRLAITAALEHYTATLAECLLGKPEARELLGTSEVRSVLLWHALEESEHKAVAFDVYRAVGGSERTRRWMMRLASSLLIEEVIRQTALSLLRDRAAYHPALLLRSLARLRHSPFLSRDMRARVRLYNKPGFHPDDLDATELVERWRVELFGTGGMLAHNLG
jgi:hypothetical protein